MARVPRCQAGRFNNDPTRDTKNTSKDDEEEPREGERAGEEQRADEKHWVESVDEEGGGYLRPAKRQRATIPATLGAFDAEPGEG